MILWTWALHALNNVFKHFSWRWLWVKLSCQQGNKVDTTGMSPGLGDFIVKSPGINRHQRTLKCLSTNLSTVGTAARGESEKFQDRRNEDFDLNPNCARSVSHLWAWERGNNYTDPGRKRREAVSARRCPRSGIAHTHNIRCEIGMHGQIVTIVVLSQPSPLIDHILRYEGVAPFEFLAQGQTINGHVYKVWFFPPHLLATEIVWGRYVPLPAGRELTYSTRH